MFIGRKVVLGMMDGREGFYQSECPEYYECRDEYEEPRRSCVIEGGYRAPRCKQPPLRKKMPGVALSWCCLSIAFLIAVLALIFACIVVGLGGYVKLVDHGVLIQSKAVSSDGFYMISDKRVQRNVTDGPNGAMALERIESIGTESFSFTEEWLHVSGAKDMTRSGLNVTEVLKQLPQAVWNVTGLPRTRSGLEESLEELQSVCLYAIIVEHHAAIQEMSRRIKQLESLHP